MTGVRHHRDACEYDAGNPLDVKRGCLKVDIQGKSKVNSALNWDLYPNFT